MVQLALSAEDASVLRSILDARLDNLRHEMARADTRSFRERLEGIATTLEGIVDDLARQLAGNGATGDEPREAARIPFGEHLSVPLPVIRYLHEHGVSYSVIHHNVAHTARAEAAAAHIPRHEWAKAVVCMADGQPTIAVVPADHIVDMRRLRELTGAKDLRLATEGEMGALYRGFETGAIPPLGPLYGHRVFVDERMAANEEVAFSAGSHGDAIRMRYRDFEALVKPTVASFGHLH
jgi:Ala-tRNA(Pro) deacylase